MLYTICMFLLLYKMRMYIHYTEHIHVYTCKYTTYVYIYMQVYVCGYLISSMYLFIWFSLMMMMVMVTMTMM